MGVENHFIIQMVQSSCTKMNEYYDNSFEAQLVTPIFNPSGDFMSHREPLTGEPCPVARSLDVVGDRWHFSLCAMPSTARAVSVTSNGAWAWPEISCRIDCVG